MLGFLVSVTKPAERQIRRFLAEQSALDFSYPDVGATASGPPPGYVVDRTVMELGAGERVFQSACAALRRWDHFHLDWVEAWPMNTPLEPGQVIGILVHALGLWWLNACRVVYSIQEPGPVERFGFAYGTLPGHAESGEERFLIEWIKESDQVQYSILAISRAKHWWTRLGYPLARRLQKRFGRDSAAAMFRSVQSVP